MSEQETPRRSGDRMLPPHLAGDLSAKQRGMWLAAERVYDASLTTEGVPETATAFQDLCVGAQLALIEVLGMTIPMLHGVALNPEARLDYTPEEGTDG